MRLLVPAPTAFVDSSTGGPAFGSYEGCLPKVDLGHAFVDRALRRKKWFWIGITSNDVWISLAIVRMGYATNAFAFVFDLREKRMIADATVVGPPRAADVVDDIHASGVLARFGFGKSSVALERRGKSEVELRARFGDLEIDAVLDESRSPSPITAIASLGPGLPSATEKRVLTTVRGRVVASKGAKSISLDDAIGGYDYTHGLMPRHTRWRWAFAMGRARDGKPIAFNMTSGFVGEAECTVFRKNPNAVIPIHEPTFDFDVKAPEKPWHLKGKGIDLRFDVGAVHAQNTNLVIVRSKFLQPAGTFSGVLTLNEEGRDVDVELDGVPGVVEDQDVLW